MPRTTPERVLATVLFTDIVGSTELAASLGDRGWHDLVARHHHAVRAQLKRRRGREIDTAGDGFFAIFDRPAQAILCSIDIIESLRVLGIEIRAGIHVGEVELSGKKAGGIAVHTAARVLGTAQPGEIVVTATVKELVAGSGIEFTDRGAATLKGIPGDWRLFTVVHPSPTGAQGGAVSGPPAVSRREATGLGWVSRRWAIVALAAVAVIGTVGVALLPRLLAAPFVPGPDTVGHIPEGGEAFDRAVDVGSQPTELAFGAGAVWVLNFRDATISRIDPATGDVGATPAVGGTPTGVAFGADAAWVTTGFGQVSGDIGSIVQFDARARIEKSIQVGNGVAAVAFGEGAVWVVDRNRELVLRIDPSNTQASPDEIQVGAAPGAIAVAAGSVWVTSTLDNTLWRIDTTTHETVATIPLLASPSAIAVGEGAVWVTSESGDTVTKIDLATNRPVTTIPVGNRPLGVATGPGSVWVAVSGDGLVAKLDPTSDSVVGTFPVDGVPAGVMVDDDGGVWVSVQAP